MALHERAGQKAAQEDLTNIPRLITAFFSETPTSDVREEQVSFGTSGHRGVSTERSFNEAHILAVTQAVCEYRKSKGIDGPLFLGADTHALSDPARAVALEVLAANDVAVRYENGYTPTPVISHAILTYNKGRTDHFGDGIVITPSRTPGASSTTRPPADRRTPMPPDGSSNGRMCCSTRNCKGYAV